MTFHVDLGFSFLVAALTVPLRTYLLQLFPKNKEKKIEGTGSTINGLLLGRASQASNRDIMFAM
jgi:hypothetical protein